MNLKFFYFAFLFAVSLQLSLLGLSLPPNLIGVEVGGVHRVKEVSSQKGGMYGIRAGYDYIKRFRFYGGIEGYCGRGYLKGHREETRLKSSLTDLSGEGRFGYTFQCGTFLFTPFLGWGYFRENIHYEKPRDFKVHFSTRFSYVPMGFLSTLFFTSHFSIGFNFKARFILKGSQKVTHDPQYPNSTLLYAEKMQYRFELPLNTYFPYKNRIVAVGVVPFYEYRHYGQRANYPFDFLSTTFRYYGVRLQCLFCF